MPMGQVRCFSGTTSGSGVNLGSLGANFAGGSFGDRKINTKTLCDLIGSRYYQHNDAIEMGHGTIVKCFDENNVVLGEMELREAMVAA